MTDLTIREASQLIRRTPATIRRYIRSGRLKARKEMGKFGEEYRIRRDDLVALGFAPTEPEERPSVALVHAPASPPEPVASSVPIVLYNELMMKHEQLLVQYGMIRAGGQKLLEYKAEADSRVEDLRRAEDRYQRLRSRAVQEIGFLRKRLKQAEAQVEERKIEITLMQEKLKRLEMAAAEAATHEGFETRIGEIREKERTIAELSRADVATDQVVADPGVESTSTWRPGTSPGSRKEDH
jgi:excisionase family DNA binding protein